MYLLLSLVALIAARLANAQFNNTFGNDSPSPGPIIGIVVGAVSLIIFVIIITSCRRRQLRMQSPQMSNVMILNPPAGYWSSQGDAPPPSYTAGNYFPPPSGPPPSLSPNNYAPVCPPISATPPGSPPSNIDHRYRSQDSSSSPSSHPQTSSYGEYLPPPRTLPQAHVQRDGQNASSLMRML
ncbi:hypothetical protein D9757_006582 [Collybiopsis confluens]|uniref:Uncharacterized protein n=1 Tax=Collybiopsis confluens TaxID=2823264 RepID=A0A8H5MBI0_9AGAR|nr:hypothetical protein D9757_006582 [Collybiopsis confluens]